MSLDESQISNKMMTEPPAKKGWHFPSDGFHFAEFIEAATIEEATAIYHKIKRSISGSEAGAAMTPAASAPAPEQSTADVSAEPGQRDV